MPTQIMKRDGSVVAYDHRKIVNAILSAGIEAKDISSSTQAQEVVDAVEEMLADTDLTSVEEVQDCVEDALIGLGYKASAKEYILYRYKRAEVRNMDKALDLVDAYMEQEDWRIKENANQSLSVQGLNNYVTGGVMSNYWLKRIYPGRIARAHQAGDMHIHDLSIISAYTYNKDEVVVAKTPTGAVLLTFEELYADFDTPEVLLNAKDDAWAKYPSNLQVLDKNGWVSVSRLVRKVRNKTMRKLTSSTGRTIIVTEDHPMITSRGEIEAANVKASERREDSDTVLFSFVGSMVSYYDEGKLAGYLTGNTRGDDQKTALLGDVFVGDSTDGEDYWVSNEVASEEESAFPYIYDITTESHTLIVNGMWNHNCVGWDLQDLLLRGFGGVPEKTVSGPAKHLDTALGQIWNFMYTLQAECAGAQAFSNFDTLLAPFVRHDNMTYEQVKQAMQMFVFNMNVSTRVGFSAPFTNITMDVTPSINLKDSPVIIGGEYQSTTYGDYQEEMDMINRAYCEVMTAGDFDGKIFPFPIPTYNLTKDLDWDHPRMDPIWKMTGRYGIPNWSNFINSDLKPEDTRSMCCRLSLDVKALRKRIGGTFASAPLTGSVGVVTINLPRIGYATKGNEHAFMERLREVFDLAALSLSIKRETVEENTEKGLYPYCRHYLGSIKGQTGRYWSNHFETIGIVGMNEALLNFMGKDISNHEARAFALRVQETLAQWVEELSTATGRAINLEATPAEGVCHRLARLDRKEFPGCEVQGEGSGGVFYTNSTHLPVGYTLDMFEALDHQEDFQTKYTGGTTFHGFIGEEITDPETVKRLVKRIAHKYRLPYFTITPTFSVCEDHGYLAGEFFECPKCGKPAQVFSRIVGYYRPVNCWNSGKQAEFKERQEYLVN